MAEKKYEFQPPDIILGIFYLLDLRSDQALHLKSIQEIFKKVQRRYDLCSEFKEKPLYYDYSESSLKKDLEKLCQEGRLYTWVEKDFSDYYSLTHEGEKRIKGALPYALVQLLEGAVSSVDQGKIICCIDYPRTFSLKAV